MDMDDSDWYSAEVYVRGTNLLAKFSKQSGNVKTDYQYYTQNAHGDVVNLTDADGEILKSYTYDAFGVEVAPNSGDVNVFRFCGEYFDTETGTIYLRARYYQASIGRFVSRDSYTGKNTDPLSLNLFTYCRNNPIFYTDPSGHKISDWLKPIPTTPPTINPDFAKDVYQKVVRPTWKKAEPYVKSDVGKIMTSQKSCVDKLQDKMQEHNFTISGGNVINVSIGSFALSGSLYQTFDKNGDMVTQFSVSAGITGSSDIPATAGISAGPFISITNAPSFDKLEGLGVSGGASLLILIPDTPIGIGGGKDFQIFQDSETGEVYHGYSQSLLVGSPGAEIHGGIDYTHTFEGSNFNVFDVYNDFYEKVMKWAES